MHGQLGIEGAFLDAGSSFPDDDGSRFLDRGSGVDEGREGHHVLLVRRKVDELNTRVTKISHLAEVLTTPDGNAFYVEGSQVGAER